MSKHLLYFKWLDTAKAGGQKFFKHLQNVSANRHTKHWLYTVLCCRFNATQLPNKRPKLYLFPIFNHLKTNNMNLIKQYQVDRQLSRWRKTLQVNQQVMILDGERIYKTEITGFEPHRIRVLAYGSAIQLTWVDMCCVFPLIRGGAK